jgi:transcription antitermination factor NusB
MVTAATRREARERAVELLYEAETKAVTIDEVLAGLPLRPDPYALELAHGVTDHRLELDALLGRHARRWPVSRMAVTDRTVLRIGAFELATQLEVPTGAALSEAVDLGGRYGSTDDTSKFVNGVLAAVAEEVRDGSRPWVPVDTVVFDMDGVIRHWSSAYVSEAEERLGLPPGAISEAAFSQPLFHEATVGIHTAEEWCDRIGEAVAERVEGCDPTAVAQVWLQSNWELDVAVIDLVHGLRAAGTRVALFSNATTKLEADLVEMELADVFDVVANSARISAAKPDVEAFRHVAGMIGSAPAQTLFVDDRDENVAGAIESGWHAVEMAGAERLGAVLRRLSVPGAPDPA